MQHVNVFATMIGVAFLAASGSAMADSPKPLDKTAATTKPAPAPAASDDGKDDDIANEARPLSIAPLLGYGTEGFNVGLGLRAGYTLTNHIYLGGTFVYHFVSDQSMAGAQASARVFYPAAEVGYDFHIKRVTLRPYGGAGVLFGSVSTNLALLGRSASTSSSSSSFSVYPGVMAAWEIPNTQAFVGGDARLVLDFDGGDPSFGVFATGGVRF
jgi:hypothetical protein